MIEGLSDLESEILIILVVPVFDGGGDLLINISAVDDEVLSDMEGEGSGGGKVLGGSSKFSSQDNGLGNCGLTGSDGIRENLKSLAE